MIIVTGGAGFIGSNVVKQLNTEGITDVIIVDELGADDKWKNLIDLQYSTFIHKNKFLQELPSLAPNLIIHMGACSDTTETDADYLMNNNYEYSKEIHDYCSITGCRLIYASSAAVYGNGKSDDSDKNVNDLMPLNMYGYTKKLFDQYVLKQKTNSVGLRFFNVYGPPREIHKGRMASVVYHAKKQIMSTGKVKLFKSYKKGVKDGEQKRDFVHVQDIVRVILWFKKHPKKSGIYNVGTGTARTFNDLAKAVFNAMKQKTVIDYVDMPEGLNTQYQYFTQANITKLRRAGYTKKFLSIEQGTKA